MNGAVAAAMALILVAGVAGAEELQGRVKSVDPVERSVALEDGTVIWFAEGLSTVTVREGASLKAVCEEREGRKIATSVTIAPGGAARRAPAVTSPGGRPAPTRR